MSDRWSGTRTAYMSCFRQIDQRHRIKSSALSLTFAKYWSPNASYVTRMCLECNATTNTAAFTDILCMNA